MAKCNSKGLIGQVKLAAEYFQKWMKFKFKKGGGVWTIRQQNTNLQILLQHTSNEDNLLEGKVDERQSL